MNEGEETIGGLVAENVADQIDNVVANAEIEAEHAREMNDQLIKAAIEGERGERIFEVERRTEECESQLSETSQAIAAIVIGLTELSAKVDLLTVQSTPTQSPTQNLPSEEVDGPPESQEPAKLVETLEVETPAPPAPPVPRKKKSRWI